MLTFGCRNVLLFPPGARARTLLPPSTKSPQDLLLWRISETVSTGALDLDVSDHSLSALPEELMEIPWVQVLNASRNRLSVGASPR